MNKGLEVIEAHELFGVDYDRIDIVVHPQSIVHSMVELRDGSTLAQLSEPDMRLPIGYALGWPDRAAAPFGALDWSRPQSLTFEPPDRSVFRCIDLAYAAGRHGGSAPAWLSAANEVAVEAFLDGALRVECASPTWWPRRSKRGSTITSTRSKGCWRRTQRPGRGHGTSSPAVRRAGADGSVGGAMTLTDQEARAAEPPPGADPGPGGSPVACRPAPGRPGLRLGGFHRPRLGLPAALHRHPRRHRDAARVGPLRDGQAGRA